MLGSMTGFGAGLSETEDYRVAIEVKAVNQRYLDLDIRAPHVLDAFAEAIKAKVIPEPASIVLIVTFAMSEEIK